MATKDRFMLISGTNWQGDLVYGVYDNFNHIALHYHVQNQTHGEELIASLNDAHQTNSEPAVNLFQIHLSRSNDRM